MPGVGRHDVVVIGAGVSGLACALELADGGRDVVVLEAAPRAGGTIETREVGDLILERGPQTVRSTPELEQLFARAGFPPIRATRRVPFVLRDGQLVRVPPPLAELMQGTLIPPLALLGGVALEPFRPHRRGPRTVREMMQERFGPRVAEALADLLTLGVYAQPADRIGFESAYPALADDLDRYRSLLLTAVARRFRKGPPASGIISTERGLGPPLESLGRQLGDRLRLGISAVGIERIGTRFRIRTGATVDSEFQAEQVVLAVPPPQAARILGETRAAKLLVRTRTEPQTLAQFAIKDATAAERWQALGFLVPPREGVPIVGCLFPNALFPGRAPSDVLLLTVFVGPSLRDESDATLAREVGGHLGRLLQTVRVPEIVDVARYPIGIPLYDRRHRDRTRAVRRILRQEGGPLLTGAGYDGVGVGSAATSGVNAARRILDGARTR